MRIGIVFGCFIPMHKGHESLIRLSQEENDKTIIGICGFDSDRGEDFIPFRQRIELTEKAVNSDNVIFFVVDDKKIGLTGKFDRKSWEIWCKELFKNAGIDPDDKDNQYTWYSGDEDYLKKISEIYQDHQFNLISRKYIPISGTLIRENPEKYIEYINPVFKEYLKKQKII